MAITTKTRKALWAKSGNRCSICKNELFSTSEGKEKLNIGEECHIISSQDNGPRHKTGLKDYDSYDNLVLLCRNHHKEIDELIDTYTEEIIRYIKLNHENWVAKTLDSSLKEKKKTKPKFVSRIISGKELFTILSNSYGYRTDYEEVETEDAAEFIGGILQELTDCGDISDMVETSDKVKMGFQLNEIIRLIEEKGYYLFAESNIEKMKFSNGDTDNWKVATLIIRRKENSEIIKVKI